MRKNVELRKLIDPILVWARDWCFVVSSALRPVPLLFTGCTILSFYFASTVNKAQQPILLIFLNTLGGLFAAVAGALFYDAVKEAAGNTTLQKMGMSAVRNLLLCQEKTRNISVRAKANAPYEELINLLSLLEKDVANSTQEWNTVVPGVMEVEAVEAELNNTQQKQQILEGIIREKDQVANRSEGEKANLRGMIDSLMLKVADLEYSRRMAAMSAVRSTPTSRQDWSPKWRTCVNCGKAFVKIGANDIICPDCTGMEAQ